MAESKQLRLVLLLLALLVFFFSYYQLLMLVVLFYHLLLQHSDSGSNQMPSSLHSVFRIEKVRILIGIFAAVPLALLLLLISGQHWIYLATEYLRALVLIAAGYVLYVDFFSKEVSVAADPDPHASKADF